MMLRELLTIVVLSVAVSPALAQAQEQEIYVPSDPSARYTVLAVEMLPGGALQIDTRREGTSGTSYARREVRCDAGQFRYVSEGTRRSDLDTNVNPGQFAAWMPESISGVISAWACQR